MWRSLLLLGALWVVWFICHGMRLWDRVRLRHLPQVPFTWRHFLLGHLADLRGRLPFLRYSSWAEKYGGLYVIFHGKSPVVVITDPEMIRQVSVAKFRAFHDRPGLINMPRTSMRSKRIRMLQSGLLMAKGAYWASLRAAMQPLFHTATLQAVSPTITLAADRLVEKLKGPAESGEAVELHGLLGSMTMQVIGESAFGIDFSPSMERTAEDRAAGIPNVGAAVRAVFGANPLFSGSGFGGLLLRLVPTWVEPLVFLVFLTAMGTTGRALEYARTTLASTCELLMNNALVRAQREGVAGEVTMRKTDWQWWGDEFRQKNAYKDAVPSKHSVLDMLMRAKNKETGQGLADMQIAASGNTLIAAGYETSANGLSFTLYLLAKHPEVQAKVQQEVDAWGPRDKVPSYDDLASFPYTEAAINEALRLFPPAFVTTRQASEDAVVGGFLIPSGTQVHFNIWGLHHDPQQWPQPESFRPERFLDKAEAVGRHANAFMPFGLGPRMCIGWRFAMQEMVLALVRLTQQYSFQLAEGHQQDPLLLRAGITLSPVEGVWMTVHGR